MTYDEAKKQAQTQADQYGYDHGISKDAFGGFMVFGLPEKRHRFGHELRCEVVMCTTLAKCRPGHGPLAKADR